VLAAGGGGLGLMLACLEHGGSCRRDGWMAVRIHPHGWSSVLIWEFGSYKKGVGFLAGL